MLQEVNAANEQKIIVRAAPKLQKGQLAKMVFQGEIFQVWQWPQKLFDGSQATFESLARADTVTILAFTVDHRIIMTRQSQPASQEFWSLPGGIVDKGETILQASQRELLEETGYQTREWNFLFCGQIHEKIDWASFYLVAKNCQKVADQQLDPGERIALELCDLNQFTELIKSSDFRNNDFALWFLRTNGEEIKNLF
jgi:ADP-ribose pyrophosphatase